MARIVIANALFLARRKVTDLVIPWCTYTDPEIAHVGYYEKDARAARLRRGDDYETLSEVDRAVLDGETEALREFITTRRQAKFSAARSWRAMPAR